MELEDQARRRSVVRPVVLLASLAMVFSACSDHQSPPTAAQSRSGGSTQVDSSRGVAASGSLVVPSRGEVLGKWRVIAVEGKRPPENAERNLRLSQRPGRKFWLSWSDGVNEHDAQWGLMLTGAFRTWHKAQTLVGCVGSCTYPSGIGVDDATALRVTQAGRLLVFLGPDGTELARYRRLAYVPTMATARRHVTASSQHVWISRQLLRGGCRASLTGGQRRPPNERAAGAGGAAQGPRPARWRPLDRSAGC